MLKLKLLLFIIILTTAVSAQNSRQHSLLLGVGARLKFVETSTNTWGLSINLEGKRLLYQPFPVQISISDSIGKTELFKQGYNQVIYTQSGIKAQAKIQAGRQLFIFCDQWYSRDGLARLKRTVTVNGSVPQNFNTALTFKTDTSWSLKKPRYFIPSIVYGELENLKQAQGGNLKVPETSITAPMAGVYFNNGISASLLNFEPKTLPDKQAGANGAWGFEHMDGGDMQMGYWYSSDDKARKIQTVPIAGNGITQQYNLTLRIADDKCFNDYYANVWRLAWKKLNPRLYHHDISVVRASLIDMLNKQVVTVGERTGIPNFINWSSAEHNRDQNSWNIRRSNGAIMGFTGKNLEAAVFLIMDAQSRPSPGSKERRANGLKIINSFIKLKMSPPVAEGFNIKTGDLMQAIPLDRGFPPQLYLRSFGDDIKILLQGYLFEKKHGREHPEWLSWCTSFVDWMLTQQNPDGSFPRSWVPVTGEVRVKAPQSSYNAIPMLVFLNEITGDHKYLRAAEEAAEFCWTNYQVNDYYVGGTIDNPNVQDKEAATLSVEAYLALYECTNQVKWLNYAKAAAANAETYIYIWEHDSGVPSIGTNKVVASPTSGADMYMSFDVDEFAKLYNYTGDKHYFDVAKILLHNTKAVMAIPGRLFDLPDIGWQTEDSKYPTKGKRGNLWLPWVATEHLNGILFLEQFDPVLFMRLSK